MRVFPILATCGMLLVAKAQAGDNCSHVYAAAQETSCNTHYAESADELEKTYIGLKNKLPKEIQPLLERDQASWLAFRKAHCDYQSIPVGNDGSMTSSARIACEADMNRTRTKDFKTYNIYDK